MTGKFIVFEGGEGGGKTTQITLLGKHLIESGRLVVMTREPGGSDLGREIRDLVLNNDGIEPIAELLLFAADRAQHVAEIKQHLSEGAIVLCDRFTYSTIAYQGHGRGLNLKLIEYLNSITTAGLKPDLIFWLDINAEVGLARAKDRNKMEAAGLEFHERVRDAFKKMWLEYSFIRVDSSKDKEVVAKQIREVVELHL